MLMFCFCFIAFRLVLAIASCFRRLLASRERMFLLRVFRVGPWSRNGIKDRIKFFTANLRY